MKSKLVLTLLATAAVVLSSCGAPRVGSLFTDVKAPVAVGSGGGSRVGTSQSQTILGLVATGDASIAAAKRNGGISSVSTVDEHIYSILGIITTYTTTVRGN
ncbi:MAG: TRL-like family protein [Akkermansia sp.]|nr:TRL-like family protein [Akkermansia sp.]MBR6575605.1 TRL-like family protein [Akkermansia sp.]